MSDLQQIQAARENLRGIVLHTPLTKIDSLSEKYGANIFLKREDLQPVRSYKLRGAYNKMASLSQEEKERGIICASAGNHAQGVAYCCQKLNIKGIIVMPETTPKQKIKRVKALGKDWVQVILEGVTFDDANQFAQTLRHHRNLVFIHPFDDDLVIAGQGTIGIEILEDAGFPVDYLVIPIGGGGLAAGLSTVFKAKSATTKIIGAEPSSARSMYEAVLHGQPFTLQEIDSFVDGAAVKRVGEKTFDIFKDKYDKILGVPEGKVCSAMLDLYNDNAIVAEPAGALSIAALDQISEDIKGKNVVCILSGSNNDIVRMEEIKERSMLYEGLKHYFIINFPQKAGALKDLVTHILGEGTEITYFQYIKKISRETGPAVVGLELPDKNDFEELVEKLKTFDPKFKHLNQDEVLFSLIVEKN